MQDFNFAQV